MLERIRGFDTTVSRLWSATVLAFALVAGGCAEGATTKRQRRPGLGEAPRAEAPEPDGDTEGALPIPGEDEEPVGSTGEMEGSTGEPESEPLGVIGCEGVDLLFVVDNSEGMREPQRRLERSVPEFVERLRTSLPDIGDIHVGVTTADDAQWNEAACRVRGALVTMTGGDDSSRDQCGPYSTGKNFMTEADDLENAFECAVRTGTDGGLDERPIESAVAALSPELNAAGGCNEGFVRPEALLVVVFLTNEEDAPDVGTPGSAGDPPDWYDDLVAVKGDEQRIVTLSLVGHEKPNACPSFQWNGEFGAEIATRIITMTTMFTRSEVGDLCAFDYDDFFSAAAPTVTTACNTAVF